MLLLMLKKRNSRPRYGNSVLEAKIFQVHDQVYFFLFLLLQLGCFNVSESSDSDGDEDSDCPSAANKQVIESLQYS